MKQLSLLLLTVILVLLPTAIQAEKLSPSALENAITSNTNGTPLAIKLAREGNIEGLAQLSQNATNGDFLKIQDKYNNNLFHVAKNADVVQVVAAMIRRFYGAKALTEIELMVNQRNSFGETPLLAQINAGHADTFRPLYAYSLLKKKNDIARNQLARLRGSGPAIEERNRGIYCKEIRQLSSAHGITLLQAAQGQIPYHPEMAPLAKNISRLIPCLVQD